MSVHHFGASRGKQESAFRLHRVHADEVASPGAGLEGGTRGTPDADTQAPLIDVPVYHPPERRRRGWASVGLLILFNGLCIAAGAWMWMHRAEPAGANTQQHAMVQAATTDTPVVEEPAQRSDLTESATSPAPVDESDTDVMALALLDAPGSAVLSLFASATPLEPRNRVDALVLSKLAELDITPARLCSDSIFLRRVYVDTLGTLPTVEEALRFLDDPDPGKRSRLIDEVLQRPEFADYWAMKWCDLLRVKAEFPIKLWPNAAQAYHRWIRTAIKNNLPYDQFAVELLTASGSNFRTPQVNFYRAVQEREPKALARAVALTFLGERAENWPAERLEGMSQFFSQVGYKPTGEWKEEIVFFDPRRVQGDAEPAPVTATFPDGSTVEIPLGQDPRRFFAEWLVDAAHPGFARAIAGRVWYWLQGQGIVNPPDDIRPDNPPVHPELLQYLADELVAADYDLRHLYRLILNSQTYQLSCVPESRDPRARENFAYYPTRRIDAEVLIDAICQITGTTESYSSIIPEPFTFLPDDQRAIALPDGSITSSFLEMFGRPARDTGLEAERNNQLSASQALHLLNSNHLRNKLKEGSGIRDLLTQADGPERLYLAILSRRPSDQELDNVIDLCAYGNGHDVAWALINSDEFLFRH